MGRFRAPILLHEVSGRSSLLRRRNFSSHSHTSGCLLLEWFDAVFEGKDVLKDCSDHDDVERGLVREVSLHTVGFFSVYTWLDAGKFDRVSPSSGFAGAMMPRLSTRTSVVT